MKRAVVWGMGVSGKAATTYLVSQGYQVDIIDISNQDDPHVVDMLLNCEFVVRSPGIDPRHPLNQQMIKQKIRLLSDIDLFMQEYTGSVMAITGTNGKTTTVMMLEAILKAHGLKVASAGNIGQSPLDLLKTETELVVLELSSFQLELINCGSFVAGAILNLSPHHGERYADFEGYASAKGNIVHLLNGDSRFYYLENEQWVQATSQEAQGQKIALPRRLNQSEEQIFRDCPLEGEHNKLNLKFAINMAKGFLQQKWSDEKCRRALRSFHSARYRFELVDDETSPIFINDSKSTNWHSTQVAVQSLARFSLPHTLILGGKLRGVWDWNDENKEWLKRCDKIILVGETTSLLHEKLAFHSNVVIADYDHVGLSIDKKGTILYSPAFPSFDHFKNYIDRGRWFDGLVNTWRSQHRSPKS